MEQEQMKFKKSMRDKIKTGDLIQAGHLSDPPERNLQIESMDFLNFVLMVDWVLPETKIQIHQE